MAQLTQAALNDALREMGPAALRKDLRDDWSEDNPTRNFCYVVAEFVFWYVAPLNSVPMELKLPGEQAPHRFVVTPDGEIIDYAAEQFDGTYIRLSEHYHHAKPKMFMQTGGVGPSKRAKQLAELLGFDEKNPKNLLTLDQRTARVAPTTTHVSKERDMLVGKYKGHEIRGEPVKDGFKIVSWTRTDGASVAQKTTKGIVDHTFKSVSQAGSEVYARMNRDFGYPENLEGRHLKFSTDSDKPARKAKAEKPEKPAKTSAKAAERETKPTKGKSTKQDVAASSTKSSKSAKPAASAGKSSGGKSKKGGSTEAGDDSSASGSKSSTRERAPFKLIKEHENQDDVRDGSTRYLCYGCLKSFITKTSKKPPSVCPAGHRIDRATDNVVIDKEAAAKLYADQDTDDDFEDLFGSDDSSDDDDGDAEEDETEDDDTDDDADADDESDDDADTDDDDDFSSLFEDDD